ncbi:MAG: hypothetical protein AB1648_06455, partial [Pseudomonadota bacterium]
MPINPDAILSQMVSNVSALKETLNKSPRVCGKICSACFVSEENAMKQLGLSAPVFIKKPK